MGSPDFHEKLRLIAEARKLKPPKRAPSAGKRFKLGKNFDVTCRVCPSEKCPCGNQPRYLLRKRIKGVRYVICLVPNDWNVFLRHMGWDEPPPF